MPISVKVVKDKEDRSKDYEVSVDEMKKLVSENKIRWDEELDSWIENANWSMT